MYTYGYNQNLGIWLATEPGVNKSFARKLIYPRLYPGVNDTGTSQMQINHKIAAMHC
jgi:hypothetical protein